VAFGLASLAAAETESDEPTGRHSETAVDETTHTESLQTTDYDEILVTASPHARRRFDVIQGTNTLSDEELERSIQTSIGETLAELPGISSTYFGPGASRPVIRGLDGPRIRVLQNGLGTLDASVTSPDHAVATDPLTAKRVEVIRGAGTLVYGSSAIGGVVNVDDGRIPTSAPDDVAEGEIRGVFASAAEEKAVSAGLTTGYGPVAFRAAGFFRDTNDLKIPGFAPSDRLLALRPDIDPGPEGVALNTDVDGKGGSLGASWLGDEFTIGGSFGYLETDYGVPAEPDEAVRIDLQQKRADVLAEWRRELLLFERSAFRFGWAAYEHQELERGARGTRFENEGYEGRLDLVQRPWRNLHGSTGFQFLIRDFEAVGEEAFTPPSKTVNWGLFAVEEYHLGDVTVEAGLRFERQSIEAPSVSFDRDFDTVSFSAGAGWQLFDDYLLGLSLSRTERAPSAEELLSNGAHLATAGFEIGNPALAKEAGLTIEGTARKRAGRWTAGLNLFYTRFDDFIYPRSEGFVDEDGNPDPSGELMLRRYLQTPADFYGGELQGSVEALQLERFTGVLDLGLDWVIANERDTSVPLPRIPPLRIKGGIEGRSEFADLRFEAFWVDAQDRVSSFELPTDAYVLLNLILTVHPFPDRRNVTLVVQGRNLLDREARVHASFLKDRLPLPGREAKVSLQVLF
jgi:iron complex outermembrane receptor protein